MEGSALKTLQLHSNKLASLDFMNVLAENKALVDLELLDLCIEKKRVEKSDSDVSSCNHSEFLSELPRNQTMQRLKLS